MCIDNVHRPGRALLAVALLYFPVLAVLTEDPCYSQEVPPPEPEAVTEGTPEMGAAVAELFHAVSTIAQEGAVLIAAIVEDVSQFFTNAGPSIDLLLNCLLGFTPGEGEEKASSSFNVFEASH
jgi:hypothetical protein